MGALWLRVVILLCCTLSIVLAARRRGSQLKCYKLRARIDFVLKPVVKHDCNHCPTSYRRTKVRVLERVGEPILEQALSDRYQEIISPRFPKPYFRNIECEWNFVVPSHHRAAVTFKSFNLENSPECKNDYVTVNGSRTPTTLCGYHEKKIKLKGLKRKFVQIRFRTDSSEAGEMPTRIGFKGFFVAMLRKKYDPTRGRNFIDCNGSNLFFERYDDNSDLELLDNGDISKTLDALLEATPNDNPELLEFTRQSVNVDWSVLEDADQGREKDQGSGQGPLPVKS
ncbi:uncharacterized protein [Oscarella lobularis]|uniref:uncharacterized protein n=1 Tax=Oscarella lobularis TaxID=121494 RepID=UPI0033139F16